MCEEEATGSALVPCQVTSTDEQVGEEAWGCWIGYALAAGGSGAGEAEGLEEAWDRGQFVVLSQHPHNPQDRP